MSLLLVLVFALALGAATPVAGQRPPTLRKHVLLLYGWGGAEVPGNARLDQAFDRELALRYSGEVELTTEYMDVPRFSGDAYEARLAALYQEKYGRGQIQLIVAFGAPALRFAVLQRQTLWPGVPIVFGMVERRDLEQLGPIPGVTGVVSVVDLRGSLDAALAVQPETKRVVVIGGASPFDQLRVALARQEFAALEGKLAFTYVTDLPMGELTTWVGRLPPDTIILLLHIFQDAAGELFRPYDAFSMVARASSVPVYGVFDTYLGAGMVGGNVVRFGPMGQTAAELASRVLAGEAVESLPVRAAPAVRVYDWRELRRWGLSRRQLPEGAVVRYREPSVWEHYRWQILGILVVCLLEAGLILKLLIERSGRRRARRALDLRVRFLEFVLEMSASAANLSPGEVANWIEGWLRRLGEFLGVDQAVLLERAEAEGTFRSLHRWSAGSSDSSRPSYRVEELPWTRAALQRGEIVRVDRLADLPAEAAVDRQICQQAGVKSFLATPLPGQKGMTGVFSLATTRRERVWPEEVIAHLRLMADLFAAALVLSRLETARRANEQLNRALLASLSAPVAVLDHGGNILEVTGTWSAIGRQDGMTDPLPTQAGANYVELCRQAEAAGNRRAHQMVEGLQSVLGGTRSEFRLRQERSVAGGEQSMELIVVSLDPPRGGAIVTQIDLTERERVEREVQELRQTMTHVGRVASLAEVAGSLAHELNQPLTAILSNVQAARRFLSAGAAPSGEFQEILSDIEEDDRRAGEIIRRLRALIRKETVEYRPVSLNDLAAQVAKVLASDMRLRHVGLEIEFDPELPEMRADPMAIQQVILNLMLNAEDAMQQTSPETRRLVVRTWQPDTQSVALSVRDYGTGILEGSPDHIFQFFRTTKKEGLGIGLAICRSIVTAHGGRIWAVNNPDGGATVQFALPLQSVERS